MADNKQSTSTTCLGTRKIEIRKNGTEEECTTAALLMVCCSSSDSDTSSNLLTVSISDGVVVYSSEPMDASTDSKLATADVFANHLLMEREGVSLVFDYLDHEGTDRDHELKAVIRQRLETGMVKLVWTGILQKNPDNNGCLSFLQKLGSTIECEHEKYEALEQQCLQLQTELSGWKDTATKLEESWQSEKDVLLENFHTLYNATHEELRKTKLAFQQLENRRQAAGNDFTSPHNNKRRPGATTTSRVEHLPDDQDELMYDMETVNRLAAGPKKSPGIMIKKTTSVVNSGVATKPAGRKTRATTPTTVPLKLTTTSPKNAVSVSPSGDSKATAPTTKRDVPRTMKSQVGAVAVASVNDLFKDPALSKRKRRDKETDIILSAKREQANKLPTVKSAIGQKKKPKISASVDDKKRKELERMSALLDDW